MTAGIELLIKQLNTELVGLGELVQQAIGVASQALVGQDVSKAQHAIELSIEARLKEREVEDICLRLLLRYQPVARDLRVVSAALKMITDMERISDQSGDISSIVIDMAGQPYIKQLEHLPMMADVASKMVKHSIDAYVKKDEVLAQAVVMMDDEADELFSKIKDDLITLIRQDVNNGEQAINLLMIAKYFERIADHAQNIAEWAAYSVTGVHKREKVAGLIDVGLGSE